MRLSYSVDVLPLYHGCIAHHYGLWAISDKGNDEVKDVPTEKNMAYLSYSLNKSSSDDSKSPAKGGEYELVNVASHKWWVLAPHAVVMSWTNKLCSFCVGKYIHQNENPVYESMEN